MKYVVGIDYGTQSGRAVVVNCENGNVVGESVYNYADGVIDDLLPTTKEELPVDWALQNPNDYLEVLFRAVPDAVQKSGVNKEDIVGVGIDFTACTVLPINEKGQALCNLDEYKNNPHAWTKLWKHHGGQPEANIINALAKEMGEGFYKRIGKISSELLLPKIFELVNDDPGLYDETYAFIEGTDWVTMQMTGKLVRSNGTLGYKALWNKREGFPSKEFMAKLNPKLENFYEEKLFGEVKTLGEKAGELLPEMAEKMGLNPGIAVAVGNIDAHVSAPGSGVVDSGKMLMIMGTSICDIVIAKEEKPMPGIFGLVEDGVIPGLYGYEAGQTAVGDIFEWFVNNCVPENYNQEARDRNIGIHELLEEKASKLKPGESGLVALDWFNGNRSILVNADLTGMILGMTLHTKPEEIYRALIEATAYGQRVIIESFIEHGVPINELYACGGLSQKNKMLMQIYADVTNKPIKVSAELQTTSLGSSMFAAVAAGKEAGGYENIVDAANNMARLKDEVFIPIEENVEVYEKLYNEYKILHDYFGTGINDSMLRLKNIKKDVKENVVEVLA